MQLRDYQTEAVNSVIRDFRDHQKILGVAGTGAGKTIMASELMNIAKGNALFIADATKLVEQNADKFKQYTGRKVSVEQGNHHASPLSKIVVGTTQSIVNRLWKYDPDHFSIIIVDEAHRNSLGDQAQKVLNYFPNAKILGLTATPWRKDRKQLGDYFEKISFEIGMVRLIKEGFLSRIVIKSVPLPIDLNNVRTSRGDYRDDDLGDVLEPHLEEAAQLLATHASNRKTVAFLPLIETSKKFRDACHRAGLYAVHVDGVDRDALSEFTHGSAQVVCNASLLTTGWDHPETDCVFMLRPTKSLSLYQQCVGRGTRIAPGKENLLLLDPLYLTDRHKIITPARLIASKPETADYMDEHMMGEEESDLLQMEEDAEEERISKLQEELEANRRKRARTVDALDFCLNLINAVEIADYEPETMWEMEPPTQSQLQALEKFGMDDVGISNRGHVSKVLDLLFMRQREGFARPKQVRLLTKLKYPDGGGMYSQIDDETRKRMIGMATFEEASQFISSRIGKKKNENKLEIAR